MGDYGAYTLIGQVSPTGEVPDSVALNVVSYVGSVNKVSNINPLNFVGTIGFVNLYVCIMHYIVIEV